MALVDSSIITARSSNAKFRATANNMTEAIEEMVSSVKNVPAYETFVSGTEIGGQLHEDLMQLQSAVQKISDQIYSLAQRTDSFLDRQEMINKGR